MKYFILLLFIAILCIIFLNLEASKETNSLKLGCYKLFTNKFKEKIVLFFLSDFHEQKFSCGTKKIISYIKKEQPSIIIIGGDMIISKRKAKHSNKNKIDNTIELLKELKKYKNEQNPHLQIIYAYGNHEARLKYLSKESENCKKQFELLHNAILENEIILLDDSKFSYNNLNIYGLTLDRGSYAIGMSKAHRNKYLTKELINKKIGNIDLSCYNILLLHTPDYIEQVEHLNFDLILCGHFHGGMVRLPIIGSPIGPNFQFLPKYTKGLYEHKKTHVLVSPGMGTHTINLRINNYPEICEVTINGTNKL